MKQSILLLNIFVTMSAVAQNPADFTDSYPKTNQIHHEDVYFDTRVSDPYRWLEDDRSKETENWVQEQNKVTDMYLSKIPYRQKIKDRLTELWNYEKYSAPFTEGGYVFYYKNDGLQSQSVLYRENKNGEPEVYLDPNRFSEDGTTSLAGLSFTKDGSLVCYQISEGGSDWRKLIIMDAFTQERVDDTLVDLKFSSVSWQANKGFYYSKYEKPEDGSALSGKTQYHQLYFHTLGDKQSNDRLIFGGEKMPRRYVYGYVTEDENYLIISAAQSTTGNELYIKDLRKENSPIVPIVTGFDSDQSVVYARNGKLYIRTNRNAPNQKLVIVDAANPQPENWKDLIEEKDFPQSFATAGSVFFVHTLKDAISYVEKFDLNGKKLKDIKLPGVGTASGFYAKQEDKETYFSFTSYIFPTNIYKYNIETDEVSLYKKSAVKFNPEEYESNQVFYPSKDGTMIPMIITHKKGLELNGENPTLLYGYGGFKISLQPGFSVSNIVFLENGGVAVVANIRGGGEYGDAWHKAGIKTQKQNVFDDFIAAAEWLITKGYTSKNHLAISGGSNGGLLVGACMTQRPDLFRVALPAVGVLDMLRYNAFTAGAGWAYDYGTAQDSPDMFKYLLSYSPLHNVKKNICYPATLVTTADHDDRVVPAHSFKFAASLQAHQSCANPTLISISVNAGHGAGKSTAQLIDEQTDKWSFLFWNIVGDNLYR